VENDFVLMDSFIMLKFFSMVNVSIENEVLNVGSLIWVFVLSTVHSTITVDLETSGLHSSELGAPQWNVH
jgi:hypothetical protein